MPRMLRLAATLVLSSLGTILQPATVARAAAMPEVAAGDASTDYLIGPGDLLRIFVLNNPDLGAEVPVRPDGKISTPLVPDVVAVGKSPALLAKEMEFKLSEMVRNPTVSVIVATAASSLSQIRVVGQAANPRAIPYRSGLGVLDVLIDVGGLSQFAAGNRAKIIRTTSSGTTEIKVRLSDLINKGDIRQNIPLRPGDVLVIPEARF